MSTAMRSTLQTVPESLEVTKPNTTSQDAPTNVSTKTPAKASSEVVATKSSRPYNYASSTNKPITIKNQMMRLLRRSKSTAAAHTEKSVTKTPPGHHAHHHYHHNHVVHPQHNRNGGGMVVNTVEGVPVVVGPGIGKTKKCPVAIFFCPLLALEMADDFLKFKIPTGVRIHSKVTRVCKVPKIYIYQEHVGLCIGKWEICEVYMCTKFVEGPFQADREENGVILRKERYHIEQWQEMAFKVTPDILDFITKKKRSGTFNPVVHRYLPSIRLLEEMAKMAARIFFASIPTDRFMTFEPCELNCETADFFTYASSMGYREFEDAVTENLDLQPEDNFEIGSCVTVIEKEFAYYYTSKYIPLPLMKSQLSDPYWRAVYERFVYKKTAVVTKILEVDLDEFEKLRKEHLKEIFQFWPSEDQL